jgi:hypothetical protein
VEYPSFTWNIPSSVWIMFVILYIYIYLFIYIYICYIYIIIVYRVTNHLLFGMNIPIQHPRAVHRVTAATAALAALAARVRMETQPGINLSHWVQTVSFGKSGAFHGF